MLTMWRNKKAITPVLSNILLMVIAVAGMSIAITATYVITGNLRDTMGERFIVEDVWFRTDVVAIYLRNTGKKLIRFAAVYMDHRALSFTPLSLEPFEHGWLNIHYDWTPNMVFHVKIVTSRGTQVADYYRSPS